MPRFSLVLFAAVACVVGCQPKPPARGPVPKYDHIFVIVEENKNFEQIMDPAMAPNISRLAASYGQATRFYGEVHPSEANYVAILGGDTFGIHDDDGFYLQARGQVTRSAAAPPRRATSITPPTLRIWACSSRRPGAPGRATTRTCLYPDRWLFTATDPVIDNGTRKTALYASKHSGFLNFASVQADSRRADKIVGFDQLDRDLASGQLPNFALIVPNQCNEMHGLKGPEVPPACSQVGPLIGRGDKVVGELVQRIQATAAWRSTGNFAIVITFDEGSGKTREGCCAVTPGAPSNFGGGHIPTIVITNHGPRGLSDRHSLQPLFAAAHHRGRVPRQASRLGHAADTDKGVVSMTPLFSPR